MTTVLLPEFTMTLEPTDDVEWQTLLEYLPPDLDQSARRYGALLRKRQIPSAATLLRLILSYATGASLDTVAARATELGLVTHLSDNALDDRIAHAVAWLGYLVGQELAGAPSGFPWGVPFRIRLLDATTLARPGAPGTDWRLHLGLDLRTGLIDHLSVTGANIGEHLADFPLAPGDLVLADRGYATRAGLAAVQASGADALVRLNWQNVPLQHPDGRAFDLFAALHTLVPGTLGEWPVQTVPTAETPSVPGRLVVAALPADQANTARRKLRATATKKGKTLRAETLDAAGYVLLFTTVAVTQLTTAALAALYRLRWRIEITFKQSKSALALDEIRAVTDRVCYAVILAKCLVLLLLDRLAWATGLFSPLGEPGAGRESVWPVSGSVCAGAGDLAAPTPVDGLASLAAECAETLLYRTSAQTAVSV
jgi:hypothetical protein